MAQYDPVFKTAANDAFNRAAPAADAYARAAEKQRLQRTNVTSSTDYDRVLSDSTPSEYEREREAEAARAARMSADVLHSSGGKGGGDWAKGHAQNLSAMQEAENAVHDRFAMERQQRARAAQNTFSSLQQSKAAELHDLSALAAQDMQNRGALANQWMQNEGFARSGDLQYRLGQRELDIEDRNSAIDRFSREQWMRHAARREAWKERQGPYPQLDHSMDQQAPTVGAPAQQAQQSVPNQGVAKAPEEIEFARYNDAVQNLGRGLGPTETGRYETVKNGFESAINKRVEELADNLNLPMDDPMRKEFVRQAGERYRRRAMTQPDVDEFVLQRYLANKVFPAKSTWNNLFGVDTNVDPNIGYTVLGLAKDQPLGTKFSAPWTDGPGLGSDMRWGLRLDNGTQIWANMPPMIRELLTRKMKAQAGQSRQNQAAAEAAQRRAYEDQRLRFFDRVFGGPAEGY